METVAYAVEEGGYWVDWPVNYMLTTKDLRKRDAGHVVLDCGLRVHAIKFKNDALWDCVNGWRQ